MKLRSTDNVETLEELCGIICWDEDEDPTQKLASGVYAVCGGEWRREQDNQWRFWEDPIIAAELGFDFAAMAKR